MKTALILSGVYWNDTIQRHHQFTYYLVKAGYRVVFVEHIVSSRFTVRRLFRAINRGGKNAVKAENAIPENVVIKNQGFVNPGSGILKVINEKKAKELVNAVGRDFDLVISYLPINTTRFIVDKLNCGLIIYDCVRNFTDWEKGMYYDSIGKEENLLLDRCDKVFADSYFLVDYLKKKTEKPIVQFLPIANDAWRRGCAEGHGDVSKIKNIGYFGTVGSSINKNHFAKLWECGYSIHIWSDKADLGGIEFTDHGYKSDLTELASDVCNTCDAIVIPYRDNVDGVIPAKLVQCLYSQKPVFITEFYDSLKLSEYLYVYKDEVDLIDQLAHFDEAAHNEKIKRINEIVGELSEQAQYEKFVREISI